MKNYWIETRLGPVVLCAPEAVMRGSGPLTLLIHGAFRGARTLLPIAQRIPDAVLANLPGHGGAPELSEASLAGWTEAFAAAVSSLHRPVLAVGESLGGLIALGLPANGIVAFDPFFETDKLWPLRATEQAAPARGLPVAAIPLLRAGHTYYDQLDRCSVTPDIVTGDLPLGAPRPLDRTPCLMDDADIARIGERARVHRISGGHNLLDENPEACLGIISEARGRLGPGRA